jgi:phenylalanyl-tRNA synthetase beta chain
MRISLNWLRELVDLPMAPEALAEMLTMAGFEVEEIEDRRTWADGVVVGNVLQRDPHPNADKLSVCSVDIGAAEPSTIVCGAANVRAGILVPVATLGSFLPKVGEAGLKIKPAKLRGVASQGMICSLSELGLTKDSEGIHIFSSDSGLKPGDDVRSTLGLDDVVLDLTSTANRADALSLVGIAREIVALTGATLRLPKTPEIAVPTQSDRLSLTIADPRACPAYIGTLIENVTIAPSPAWLQQRLQASGIRPISNVVDITNYVLLEWGQPLHAFDRDRLLALNPKANSSAPLAMGVRFASPQETLQTLDGQTRRLTEPASLITAYDQPVALAGIMGGATTEVHDSTQALLLEAALFDTAVTRRSARSQGLRTEASARYERGVNQAELELACRRAVDLLAQLAGGTVTAQAIADHRSQTNTTRDISLRLERVQQVLGPVTLGDDIADLQAADVERTLTALGCQLTATQAGETWTVAVPPYRCRDLEREIDLIEEIARLYGYNNFCETLPEKTEPGYLSPEQFLLRKVREACRAVGLTELVHYSLGKPGEERQIVLSNPLFPDYSALRTNLLSGLIDAFQYNLEQGNQALWGFEIGRIFWLEDESLNESEAIAGIFGGDPTQGRWVQSGRSQPLTWYEAKGVLDSIFQRLTLSVEYQPDRRDERLHPGRTASLWLRGTRLGTFGQLHPQLRRDRALPDQVYAFELDMDVLLDELSRDEQLVPILQPYSTYPPSDRDLAFFIATKVSVAEIERVIHKVAGSLLEQVELFDDYRGQNVPEGQRSLAFRLVYRAGDRTLTDDDIEPVHQAVREALVEKFSVELRS